MLFLENVSVFGTWNWHYFGIGGGVWAMAGNAIVAFPWPLAQIPVAPHSTMSTMVIGLADEAMALGAQGLTFRKRKGLPSRAVKLVWAFHRMAIGAAQVAMSQGDIAVKAAFLAFVCGKGRARTFAVACCTSNSHRRIISFQGCCCECAGRFRTRKRHFEALRSIAQWNPIRGFRSFHPSIAGKGKGEKK